MLRKDGYSNAVKVFFCYSSLDEDFQKQLSAHFANLRRRRMMTDWDLYAIKAGRNRKEEIDNHLNSTDIILLLISANFMDSDDCWTIATSALERHRKGEVKAIPIVLKDVDITGAPFSELTMLPKGNRPIASWSDSDKAYTHIVSEIGKIIADILGMNDDLKDLSRERHLEQRSQEPCPYLGLKPYSEYDASLFFGREAYIFELMHKLSNDERLLLVLGPIGSGKTSVIQAGVVPLLRKGSKIIPRSFEWEILTFTPGESPFSQLMSLIDAYDFKNIIEGISSWKRQHPKRKRLVLVMDQFEELFKLVKTEEQKYFIEQLLKIVIHDLATIIIVMSDAYYNALAEYVDFMKLAEQQISNISPLELEEIMEVIQKPAEVANLYFADNLVEKIADDTVSSTKKPKEQRKSRHSSVLPLLSVCLQQLWEMQQDHYVTLEDYESVGQVSGALTAWATEAFNDLEEKQQYLARRILVDLVEIGDDSEGRLDYRRQKLLTELCHNNNEIRDVQEVVEKLAKAHLLETQLNEQKKDITVKIIHESLLREWSLLKSWLREDYQFLLWYQEFEQRMQKWIISNKNPNQRDAAYLLRGRILIEAQQWLAEFPHRFRGEAQNFVLAGVILRKQEEQREEAFRQSQTLQRIALAKQLATKALLIQEQEPYSLRKSLLIAVEALRRHHCVEADQALRQGLAMLPRFIARINMAIGQIIVFSGDGYSLATAGTNGVFWMYNVNSSEELAQAFPLGDTRAIALSYNGEYLLAGVYAGVAWFINTVKVCRVAMIKQNTRIHCVALTQREPYVAAIGCDDGRVSIYQFSEKNDHTTNLSEDDLIQNARLLYTFHHNRAVSSLSLSHDERYLISGGMDQTVQVWNIEERSYVDMYDFKSPICSAVFSPDDTSIVVVSEDGKAFVWQWAQKYRKLWQRKQNRVIRIPQAENVQAVAFSPKGDYLVTASVDGFARVWNLLDMIEVKLFPHNSSVSSICYHQSEDWLATASADGNARIYNVSDGVLKYSIPHDKSVLGVALSSQKPYLATADGYENVWVWQLHDGNLPICFRHSGKVIHFAFDEDSDENELRLTIEESDGIKIWVISLASLSVKKIYEFGHISGWSVTKDVGQLAVPKDDIKMRVFSLDKYNVADVTIDNIIMVMKTSNSKYERTIKAKFNINILVFSHKRDYIAIVDDKGYIFIWKWREKNSEPILLSSVDYVRELFFSKDDENLIVADNKNRVLIWQWGTKTKEPNMILRHEDYVHTISLCPDKRYLLTTSDDKRARVWDITTGLLVQYLSHKDEVVAAAFDNEGKYIATASSDHTVGIWDAQTGEQLSRLVHDNKVYAVVFSKDGRYLATACDDSLVRVWLWKREDLEVEAKLRLTGNLTLEEWQEYIGNEPYRETFIDLGWRKLPRKDISDEE